MAAPRWFHEGIAVFVDTWMAGGTRPRAERLRRDGVPRDGRATTRRSTIRSAWSRKAPKIDFQLEINSYLYGTRFMTWLARRYSPEQLIDWTARREGSRAYYADAVPARVRRSAWKRRGRDWIADERTFQQANLEAIRKYPITPYRDVTSRALGSVSRAYYDPASKKIYAAFNYPGVVAHVGAHRHRERRGASASCRSRDR